MSKDAKEDFHDASIVAKRRDEFAMAALSGLLSNASILTLAPAQIVAMTYEYADLMETQRKKGMQ